MSYIAYIYDSLDWIVVDAQFNTSWVRAITSVIPKQYRVRRSGGVYRFSKHYYDVVLAITDTYFVKIQNTIERPDIEQWGFQAWIEYQRGAGDGPSSASLDSDGISGAPDPRSILHVTSDAPDVVITAAWRALCKIHHPDHGGDNEQFRRINDAYNTLRTSGDV